MIFSVADVVLRRPEPADVEALFEQKNDPRIANLLGGFSLGYTRTDIAEWVERHRKASGEVIWSIALAADDRCIGHVGLYGIDHRVRSAEFAIMIGDATHHGKGLGKQITRFVVNYGFEMLNLNRVQLSLLTTNARALRLYESLGFVREGVLRQAQFKGGQYLDVILMSVLRDEWLQRDAG